MWSFLFYSFLSATESVRSLQVPVRPRTPWTAASARSPCPTAAAAQQGGACPRRGPGPSAIPLAPRGGPADAPAPWTESPRHRRTATRRTSSWFLPSSMAPCWREEAAPASSVKTKRSTERTCFPLAWRLGPSPTWRRQPALQRSTWRWRRKKRRRCPLDPHSEGAWRPAVPPPAGSTTPAACPCLPSRGWSAGGRLGLPVSLRWAGRPGWSCSGSGRRKLSRQAALRSRRPPSPSAILCTTVCRPAEAKDDPAKGWGGQRAAHGVHRQWDTSPLWTCLLDAGCTAMLPNPPPSLRKRSCFFDVHKNIVVMLSHQLFLCCNWKEINRLLLRISYKHEAKSHPKSYRLFTFFTIKTLVDTLYSCIEDYKTHG